MGATPRVEVIYLWLMVFTLIGPLSHSFDRRIYFYKKFWALWPAISFTAFYFLVWDYFFTIDGVWGFNPRYLWGPHFFSLPVEEISFFFIVPFACVFLYEVMKYYVPRDIFFPYWKQISIAWILILLPLIATFHDRAYTAIASAGSVALLLAQLLWLRGSYMGRFWMGYLISLIPFFLVNGVLTGSFIEEPVVWYNNNENMGVRMGTIPVEDSIYLLWLLLSVITIYEELQLRRSRTVKA